MRAPKVSIIIPTHNRPNFLLRALASVYAQTFTDYEVFVIDDGDSPRVKDILNYYLENKKNFFYRETEKNKGGAVARNIGIKEARGAYIAFLDDDDEWVKDKLQIQMSLFENAPKDVGFSFTAVTMCGDSGETNTVVPDGIFDFSERALSDFNGFLTVTQIIRKNIFDEIGGFDEGLQSHQEPELVIRMTQAGYRGCAINQALTRVHALSSREGIGTNYLKRIQGRLFILEKHNLVYKKNPVKLARSYFEVALWYRHEADWKNAQKYMLLAWKCRPLFVRYFVHVLYVTVKRLICTSKNFLKF